MVLFGLQWAKSYFEMPPPPATIPRWKVPGSYFIDLCFSFKSWLWGHSHSGIWLCYKKETSVGSSSLGLRNADGLLVQALELNREPFSLSLSVYVLAGKDQHGKVMCQRSPQCNCYVLNHQFPNFRKLWVKWPQILIMASFFALN